MIAKKKITRSEDATLKHRLISCMPASRYEMETLCRLSDIVATRDVATAAVECKRRPRLLINPDFVENHCTQDEHLFLLVMHELWHVLLAHTRMYPQMTEAHNIAFDAIINAGLMRQFPGSEYRGFFDKINPADKFPHCLLRPPIGWPSDPEYPDVGPPGTKELLKRLYPTMFIRRQTMPLYEEILNLLKKSGMSLTGNMPILLGNHDGTPIHEPLLKEAIKQAIAKWPKFSFGAGGGRNLQLGDHARHFAPTGENTRRVFAKVLRANLGNRHGRDLRKSKMPISTTSGNGVIPNPKDRLAPAKRMLGIPTTLWAQTGEAKARIPERPSRAFIYLDVSGSMNYILPYLMGLLFPYVTRGQAEVFQFSTEIAPLLIKDLKKGKLRTTGGTNINCVLEHMLNVRPRVDRVLILTDGAIGAPLNSLSQQLQEKNIRMHVILPHNRILHYGVQPLASAITTLPPIN